MNGAFATLWLCWCIIAYVSPRFAPSLAMHLVSPAAALVAGFVGLLLGGAFVLRHRARALHGHWLPLRAWPARAWAGIAAGTAWLAVQLMQVADGRLGSVFGVYIVLAVFGGFVYARLRVPARGHGRAVGAV